MKKYFLLLVLIIVLIGCKKEIQNPIGYNSDFNYQEFTDKREGHNYKCIEMGNQVWVAENLMYDEDPNDHDEDF